MPEKDNEGGICISNYHNGNENGSSCKSKRGSGTSDPVPRQISAGCGMAWCAPIADRVSLEQLIATEQIVTEGCYELLL